MNLFGKDVLQEVMNGIGGIGQKRKREWTEKEDRPNGVQGETAGRGDGPAAGVDNGAGRRGRQDDGGDGRGRERGRRREDAEEVEQRKEDAPPDMRHPGVRGQLPQLEPEEIFEWNLLGLARDLLPGVRPEQMKLGHRELKGINDRIEVAKNRMAQGLKSANDSTLRLHSVRSSTKLDLPRALETYPVMLIDSMSPTVYYSRAGQQRGDRDRGEPQATRCTMCNKSSAHPRLNTIELVGAPLHVAGREARADGGGQGDLTTFHAGGKCLERVVVRHMVVHFERRLTSELTRKLNEILNVLGCPLKGEPVPHNMQYAAWKALRYEKTHREWRMALSRAYAQLHDAACRDLRGEAAAKALAQLLGSADGVEAPMPGL